MRSTTTCCVRWWPTSVPGKRWCSKTPPSPRSAMRTRWRWPSPLRSGRLPGAGRSRRLIPSVPDRRPGGRGMVVCETPKDLGQHRGSDIPSAAPSRCASARRSAGCAPLGCPSTVPAVSLEGCRIALRADADLSRDLDDAFALERSRQILDQEACAGDPGRRIEKSVRTLSASAASRQCAAADPATDPAPCRAAPTPDLCAPDADGSIGWIEAARGHEPIPDEASEGYLGMRMAERTASRCLPARKTNRPEVRLWRQSRFMPSAHQLKTKAEGKRCTTSIDEKPLADRPL
jgi:hypothetical protein